jgi:1-acyl-sn-glycerol-3-phosphate acyltransferase
VSLAPPSPSAGSRAVRRRATGTRRPCVVRAVRAVGTGLARVLFRLRVKGMHHVPREGPVLLAGNHSGILDGPLVFFVAPRPPVLLTKSEVFVGVWPRPLGWLGLVPVHRGAADRAALKAGLAELQAGGVVGVFPEGTRGSGGMERISDGLAYLALRSGASVVPIAVTGTAAALPPGRAEHDGDPRARRTVRAAAEQLRIALVEHLRTATRESA